MSIIDFDSINNFLNENLINSTLNVYSIGGKFLELEFFNDEFSQIVFNLDCKIWTSDLKLEHIAMQLKEVDQDTYIISYFVGVDSHFIKAINYSFDFILIVTFDNDISIYFELKNDNSYDGSLNISFYKESPYKNETKRISFEYTGEAKIYDD